MPPRAIQLRGVEVHNLKHVDLDLPHGRLIVFCGVSGSGKTSLALDTLYAEGQRRYIESFSAYTRQFLERLEKPAAERIDNIPPAVAVTRRSASRSNRSTIGTSTETADYLRLLYAKIARLYCPGCGRELRRQSPQSAAEEMLSLGESVRFLVAFGRTVGSLAELHGLAEQLRETGFARLAIGGGIVSLAEADAAPRLAALAGDRWPHEALVIVDRLTGAATPSRARESFETAFDRGGGWCVALIAAQNATANAADTSAANGDGNAALVRLDGAPYRRIGFSRDLHCAACDRSFANPEPRLFSFNSPLGACPECEGFGNILDIDMDLVAPQPQKSLREGALAPWSTPAYAHELEELIALAPDYGVPLDIPFAELSADHLRLIVDGVPERNFGGLRGFFAWLERRKYKMHLRVFLARWRSYRPCPACAGSRLRPEALAWRLGGPAGKNIAELCQLRVDAALPFLQRLELTDGDRAVARTMLEQAIARLGFLDAVGLGYLTLDRTLRTLSGGEAQRVALTSALGSSLVNMLYVLDEPSVGLHPSDVDRLLGAIAGLRDRGNTVVVVEHEEALLRAADWLVEFGPAAGERGGRITFQGTPAEMLTDDNCLTGAFLAGRRGVSVPEQRRPTQRGRIRLSGARGNNLRNLTVEFPLGVLCLVTGVSGSGKSTLVQDTLYGALCLRKKKDGPKPYPYDDVVGDGQIDDVLLVDQSPISRSPRSNPVTYIKAFDEIRAVFADTIEARTHNYTAGHFSFNVDGGRCDKCQGDGYLQVDMQFLADVLMKCDQCGGRRYRKEILNVHYRGRSIADVLEMTVREAFSFFRGQAKVMTRLKPLLDVGLDYLRLGQPASTLSAGEAQRLKLAGYLSAAKRNRTLFLLDEPTTGLHFSDVVQLLDCFDALLAVGHSLVIVEHNLQLMRAADWIIELGPGAGDDGGQVVVEGTPEEVALRGDSPTGSFLAAALAAAAQPSA